MSLNRKARRQFENKSARRTKVIGVATAGSVVATQAALLAPAFAAPASSQVVTNCGDTGAGSLRAAIEAANSNADLTTITFELDPTCDTITLQTALPQITESIDIQGPGAGALTIVSQPSGDYYIFSVTNSAQDFSLSGVTLSGAGVIHWGDSGLVQSHDTIDSIVIENARTDIWELLGFSGAGNYHSQVLIQNSTFTNNDTNGTSGIQWLVNSGFVDMTIRNNTIINNSFGESMISTNNGDSIFTSNTVVTNDSGAGNWNDPTFKNISLFGNIISDLDTNNADICLGTTDLGANLFEDTLNTGSCAVSPLPSGPQTNGSSAKVSADALALGSLADNGGPTETIAIGDTSVAHDYYTSSSAGIDGSVSLLELDQRGASRPADSGYDVGAFELNGVFPTESAAGGGASCTETKLGTIRFAPYSSKLSKKSKKLIRAYVAKIKDSGCTTIDLTAHTATTTGAAKSLKAKRIALSKARNAAVQKYLTKQLKKAGITVTFKKHAMGAKNPAKSNKTETGRAMNRRVVVVMKALRGTL